MDVKFNKVTTESENPVQEEGKGRQTGLLVLLLVLLGGFGYLYFFTGLIRPQEAPPTPQPAPQVIKQPLPARDAVPTDTAKSAVPTASPAVPVPLPGAAPAAPGAQPPQKTADVKVKAAPAVSQKEKKSSLPVAKSTVKPEPAKAAAAPVTKKVEPAKPVVTAKAEPKKVLAKKTEEKQSVTVKGAHPALAGAARKKASASKPGGPWTVVVGLYVVEETLAADLSKVKKAGLTPVMTIGPKRPVSMNRLFYGEYTSKEEAQQVVDKLQRSTGDGFTVQRGGKHEVYAGSYAVLSGAQSEQQRLAAAGIKVTIKKIQVPLASRKLTVGTFTDRKAADEALKKLKNAGIGTPVLE